MQAKPYWPFSNFDKINGSELARNIPLKNVPRGHSRNTMVDLFMCHYLGAPPGMSLMLSCSTQSKFTSERNYRFLTGVLYTTLLKAITQ